MTWLRSAVLMAALANMSIPAKAGEQSQSCYYWATIAEDHYKMPRGLMRAIITNESGGNPNTLNVDGRALYFNTPVEAAKAVQALAPVSYEVDVGCAQLTLRWHGQRFKTIGGMLDPRVNLSYAAWHLADLKERYGSWTKAAARYHSFQPERGRTYACKVWAIMKKSSGELSGMENPCSDIVGATSGPIAAMR